MSKPATSPTEAGSELSELLTRAARSDQAAWRRLVELYAGRVFAMAKSRVRSPELAEEITQSVMVTVASKLGSGGYAEQGRFESWLFRIAGNRIRDEVRRNRRQAHTAEPEVLAEQPATTTDSAGTGESLPALRRAMDALSDADREVLELRHHGGLAFAQIAEMLAEPIGTVLARHHRALRKLKDLLGATASPEAAGRTDEDRA
jgi:RNA polymerase sigma-70 factor (ECF subfamily)